MAELPIEKNYLPVPEGDLTRIATAVKEQHEGSELVEPQLSHQAIRSTLQGLAGIPVAAPAPVPAASDDTLPDYLATAPAELKKQVEALIETAKHKGIDAAHDAAKKSDDPFVLDAFHDVMSGKLYRAFKDRGLMQ